MAVHAHMCVLVEVRGDTGCLPPSLSALFIEAGALLDPSSDG